MLEIEIPTKLYIKRYLENKYGTPPKLTRKQLEGCFLYELIEDPRYDREKNAGQFLHITNVILPDRVLLRKGSYLTRTQTAIFNSFMEQFIKVEMRNHIDLILRRNPETEIRHAIGDYQQTYGLHDDFFPFDSLKKDYYRYRIRSKGQIRHKKSMN